MVASVNRKPADTLSHHAIAVSEPGGSSTSAEGVVLVGNPNVGKSAIFNALTGMNADVSNYPGTTIDIARGKLGNHDLIDTPGIYGVSSFNDEERIARSMIVETNLVVNVISALSLDRDLFLTLQLLDMGKRVLLVVNQWDEAEYRRLKINVELLSQLLGIKVITTVAINNQGVDDIPGQLAEARAGNVDPEIAAMLQPLLEQGIRQDLALLALEGDGPSATACGATLPNRRAEIYRLRRGIVNSIFEQTVEQTGARQTLSTKIGRLLLHPFYGSVISMTVCYLLFYQLLGVLIAGKLVDFTEKQGMRVFWEPNIRRLAANIFPCEVTIGDRRFSFPEGTLAAAPQADLFERSRFQARPEEVQYNFWSYHNVLALAGNTLVGEYGVLTLTVTYLLGLLFPLVAGFYLGLSLMEDSGYLPRLAVLVDRLLNKAGLNGRAIIPLILGLGCVTMATVTTRLLSTRREKIIATVLLGIAIPCSAQLGIVSGTLARCGGVLSWAIYGIAVFGMLAGAGLLLNAVMPGKSAGLMIDLPPMRLPRARNVLKKTWTKSCNFMSESLPMFCLAGLVVTAGSVTGALDWLIKLLQPLTVNWLHLPNDPRIATTFILGIVRRDFAAFGLTDVTLTSAQALVAMIVITLFVPCIASVGIMIKERGARIAMAIWLGSWLCAFGVGGLFARVLPPFLHFLGS